MKTEKRKGKRIAMKEMDPLQVEGAEEVVEMQK